MYFKFNKDRIEYMKKYVDQMPYEVEFFNNTWVMENMKAALKEKYDGLMAFLQVNVGK
jgi:adenine-specific DNA methylase